MAENRIISRSPESLLCAICIGSGLSAWNLFHERGFFFIAGLTADVTTWNYAYYSCVSALLGGVFATVLFLILRKRCKFHSFKRAVPVCILLAQFSFGGMFYYSLIILHDIPLVCVSHFLFNIAFYSFAIILVIRMCSIQTSELVHILVTGVLIYALLETLDDLLFFNASSLSFSLVAHFLFLVASSICLWHLQMADDVPFEEKFLNLDDENHKPVSGEAVHSAAVKGVHIATPLVLHTFLYSFAFGVMHNIASAVVSVPQMKLSPSHVGMFCGALLFYLAFVSRYDKGRIWTRVRMVVFPVAMLSFIFLPLSTDSSSELSILFGECAQVCYFMIAMLGCAVISKRVMKDKTQLVASGMALLVIGFFSGVSVGNAIKVGLIMNPLVSNATVYSILNAAIFMILVAATFWVGDDRRVSLLWGMEEKLPPKNVSDAKLHAQCEMVSEEYSLTRREAEILEMLLRGERPSQISSDLVVSMSTVRTHIHSLYEKLDVHSYAELTGFLNAMDTDKHRF